jgi:hypothetical protein
MRKGTNLMTHERPLKAFSALAIACFIVTAADADVLDAAPGGFTISYMTEISASRTDVYRAAVDNIASPIGDGSHTRILFSELPIIYYTYPRYAVPVRCYFRLSIKHNAITINCAMTV